MAFDMLPDADALEIAGMYAEAGELPGYARYAAEREIGDYLATLRTRAAQREWLSEVLRPFGFYAASLPNWRGSRWQ